MTTDTDRGAFDQAEYDRRFHGDFMYDATMEDEEGGGGRSPLFIILTALVLMAFGAVVYVAYQQGVTQGGDRNSPPVITAEAGPVRVAPENPGGATVPDQDKQIYERISTNDKAAETTSETGLAAPPEEPIDLPAAAPDAGLPPDAKMDSAAPADATAAVVPAPAPVPAAPAIVAPPPAPVVTAAKPEDDAKAKAAALTAEIAKTDPGAAAAASGPDVESGAFVVQLGSFKSDGEAASMWQTVKTKNVDQLGTFKPAIKRVDLGSKGVWYRLRVGPFANRADATALCEVLKTRKSDCMVDTP